MNIIKKLSLITFTLLVMSFAAFAQQGGDKKDPPKKDKDKPEIIVKDKDRGNKDKEKPPSGGGDRDKPKKPSSELAGLIEAIKIL